MDREDEVRKISIISAPCWMDLVSHMKQLQMTDITQ